jgi:hypothetical protein
LTLGLLAAITGAALAVTNGAVARASTVGVAPDNAPALDDAAICPADIADIAGVADGGGTKARFVAVADNTPPRVPEGLLVIDVDTTGLKNGTEINSTDSPDQFKNLCPRTGWKYFAQYTKNEFEELVQVRWSMPKFTAVPLNPNCLITVKVLDPKTGKVLETYEAPSDLIKTKRDAIGFVHAPGRIRFEIKCKAEPANE